MCVCAFSWQRLRNGQLGHLCRQALVASAKSVQASPLIVLAVGGVGVALIRSFAAASASSDLMSSASDLISAVLRLKPLR